MIHLPFLFKCLIYLFFFITTELNLAESNMVPYVAALEKKFNLFTSIFLWSCYHFGFLSWLYLFFNWCCTFSKVDTLVVSETIQTRYIIRRCRG